MLDRRGLFGVLAALFAGVVAKAKTSSQWPFGLPVPVSGEPGMYVVRFNSLGIPRVGQERFGRTIDGYRLRRVEAEKDLALWAVTEHWRRDDEYAAALLKRIDARNDIPKLLLRDLSHGTLEKPNA